MDVHELVAKVKEWAATNGRAPTRGEFESAFGGSHVLARIGGFSQLLHMAGFSSYRERQRRGETTGRLTNEIFTRPIVEATAEYKPRAPVVGEALRPTLVIPDTHFPWANQRVLDAAYRFAEKMQPELIIQVGDLYDLYAHAKFPKSMNLYKPLEEEELGRKGAEAMWQELQKSAPKAKCVQLKGNHDIRALRRTLETQPQIEHVVARHLDKIMSFPDVELVVDHRQEYVVGNVEFLHGHKSHLGGHRDYALMNAVCGHIHVGGAVFRRIRGQTLWELNCGLAGDPEAKVFGYTPQKITQWTPGFGFLDEYGPRFIPVG